MILKGKVWKFGNNVAATTIVAAAHDKLGMSHQWTQCAKHLLADVDPVFASEVRPGDLLIAGEGFGSGHAHYYSTAIMAMKTAGLGGCFVEGVATLFQRAAIDFGLPTWSIAGISSLVERGDELELDLRRATARNLSTGATMSFAPVSPIIVDILEAGGSENWALARIAVHEGTPAN